MRTLVAGGAGFLGSHLCEYLLARDHTVVCLDNFYTGRHHNISHLLHDPRFRVIRHDVASPVSVEVDEIYSLACPASPIHYQLHPVQTTRACVLGSINMLDLARQWDIRILQASTSEVYGNPTVHPQPESYWGNVNPIGPRSCYDEGKRCAETLFFDYQRQYGVSVRVARIFNTYGPRMLPDDGRVVSNFIVQALSGQPLTIYGSGSQTRSFCYVDDLVRGLVRLMEHDDDAIGPVNLGNPEELSIEDAARLIIEMTGEDVDTVHEPLPHDDPQQRRPDITLARELLGWEPVVSLRAGLSPTIEHFRAVLQREEPALEAVNRS